MFPLGAFFARNVTLKMGQTPARGYMSKLYQKVTTGEIDPKAIITHQLPLDDAAHAYQIFNEKQDDCIKVILKP